MRGRWVFVAGLGVGYVLGARAGRERFDQIVAAARKFWDSPTVQEASGVVQAQASKLYTEGKHAVSDQVHKLGKKNGGASGKKADSDADEDWDTAVRRTQFPANAF